MHGKREEWAERVRQWKESGLTAREFAESTGVNRLTLRHWASQLRRRPRLSAKGRKRGQRSVARSAGGFVELVADGVVDGRFELELGGGRRLRIPASFEVGALQRPLAVLEAQR